MMMDELRAKLAKRRIATEPELYVSDTSFASSPLPGSNSESEPQTFGLAWGSGPPASTHWYMPAAPAPTMEELPPMPLINDSNSGEAYEEELEGHWQEYDAIEEEPEGQWEDFPQTAEDYLESAGEPDERWEGFLKMAAAGTDPSQLQVMIRWLINELQNKEAENAGLQEENLQLRHVMSGCSRCSQHLPAEHEDIDLCEHDMEENDFARLITPIAAPLDAPSTRLGIREQLQHRDDEEHNPFDAVSDGCVPVTKITTPRSAASDSAVEEQPFRRLVTPDVSEEQQFKRLITPIAIPLDSRLVTPDASALDTTVANPRSKSHSPRDPVFEVSEFKRLVTPIATAIDSARTASSDDTVDSLGEEPAVFSRLVTPSIQGYLRPPCDPNMASVELVRLAYVALQARQQQEGVSNIGLQDSGKKFRGTLSKLRERFSELVTCDPRLLDYLQMLSFWLNVMNAATLAWLCLAKRQPGQSGTLFPVNSWVNFLQTSWINVGGKRLSLFEIEHKILRAGLQPPVGRMPWFFLETMQKARHERTSQLGQPIVFDPSDMALQGATPEVSFGIHYPIRAGCPPLRVYMPQSVRQQLTLNCAHYIHKNFHVNVAQRQVCLPVLFKHYSSDFGSAPARVLEYVHGVLEAVPSALRDVTQLTGCQASRADLELLTQSRPFLEELAEIRCPALTKRLLEEFEELQFQGDCDSPSKANGSTPGSSNSAPVEASKLFSDVKLQALDFNWEFDFPGQTVCPEIERLSGLTHVPSLSRGPSMARVSSLNAIAESNAECSFDCSKAEEASATHQEDAATSKVLGLKVKFASNGESSISSSSCSNTESFSSSDSGSSIGVKSSPSEAMIDDKILSDLGAALVKIQRNVDKVADDVNQLAGA